jgi:heptaprenyl diphosphate synthase
MKTQDITLIGILASLAVVLSILESTFIPTFILGVKLGLANIVTIVGIYLLDFKKLLGIALIRTFISSLLLGKFLSPGYLMSVSGAVMSLIIIYIIYLLYKEASPVFLSIIGAIVHNIAQLVVAYFIVGYGFIYYLPYLIILAVPAGIITGLIAKGVLKGSSKYLSKVIE